jgi:phosphatidylglycerol:prolipoprotein diacylglycerol transferase
MAVIDVNINPVLVHIGPLSIHWYGVMYVVGIAIALLVALPYAEARGVSRDRVMEIFFPIVLAGLVGGRLYYVVQSNLGHYLSHPWQILATWEGGMAFFGAIFGATAMIVFLCRRGNPPLWVILDAAAIFAPLGQAFGRIGNIVNGDIVGYPSHCLWCTKYTNPGTFAPRPGVPYQPAAAYELLISLAIFTTIFLVRFRLPRQGLLFCLYLALYSVGQFGIFFVRKDPTVALGLKQAQITAIATFIAALLITAWVMRSKEPASSGWNPTRRPPRPKFKRSLS